MDERVNETSERVNVRAAYDAPPRVLSARTLCPCAIHCALLQNHVCAVVFIEPPHRSTAHDPSKQRRTGGRLSPSRLRHSHSFVAARALENLAEPTSALLQQTQQLTFTLALQLLHGDLTTAGAKDSSNQ